MHLSKIDWQNKKEKKQRRDRWGRRLPKMICSQYLVKENKKSKENTFKILQISTNRFWAKFSEFWNKFGINGILPGERYRRQRRGNILPTIVEKETSRM